jgi:hypothetical protein
MGKINSVRVIRKEQIFRTFKCETSFRPTAAEEQER